MTGNILDIAMSMGADGKNVALALQNRYNAAVARDTGICVPSESDNPYFPFHEAVYPYGGKLNIYGDRWTTVMRNKPEDLVPVDPFEPGIAGGLKVWDAAVGIPESIQRNPEIISIHGIRPLRSCNREWLDNTTACLARVGNFDGKGFKRPSGPLIYDLTKQPEGWRLLEGAHALVHRFEFMESQSSNAYFKEPALCEMVFRLVACLLYGLPFNVRRPAYGLSVEQYGLELCMSTNFRSPSLRVPVIGTGIPEQGTGVPIPDETVGFLCGGVYIEPHPRGFTNRSMTWNPLNMWACMPTLVVFAGWELIDVVSHQQITALYPSNAKEPVMYGMSAADLRPMLEFPAFLWSAIDARGLPETNDDVWMIHEWLDSDDYKHAVAEAPPLPCSDCIKINVRAEGAPSRPRCRLPEPRSGYELRLIKAGKLRKTFEEEEWERWDTEIDNILDIVESAVIYYEGKTYGHVTSSKQRRLRKAAYRKKRDNHKKIANLESRIDREYRNGRPTEAERLTLELEELRLTTSGKVIRGSHKEASDDGENNKNQGGQEDCKYHENLENRENYENPEEGCKA